MACYNTLCDGWPLQAFSKATRVEIRSMRDGGVGHKATDHDLPVSGTGVLSALRLKTRNGGNYVSIILEPGI